MTIIALGFAFVALANAVWLLSLCCAANKPAPPPEPVKQIDGELLGLLEAQMDCLQLMRWRSDVLGHREDQIMTALWTTAKNANLAVQSRIARIPSAAELESLYAAAR